MNDLLQKFLETRQRSGQLCAPLHKEDYIPQPVDFVSPPKWHLAHITWFFEEMILKKFLPGYQEFDKDFCFLFNSYYQSIGVRTLRNQRGFITRPGVEEVFAYRKHVDEKMTQLLSENISPELGELVVLGINHEQQHQELFITDLKYILHCNPIFPVYHANANMIDDINTEKGLVQIKEGIYDIGATGEGFHFDNEYNYHKVFLRDFEISRALVTNGEYLEFINAGGYKNFKYWLDEGWAWVQREQIEHPLYWHQKKEGWYYFTLAGLKPVNEEAILSHISFYEAQAFATWKGMRLPTEQEWEVASGQLAWGKRWEWTYSAYLPYPGFTTAEGAVGEYNGKFMINQMVLRGASVATAMGHSRNTYRNFFHPHFQWQFTGIRLAK